MTSYIPSMTLPRFIFEHPAASVLLPIALGTAVGFSNQPSDTQKTYMALKQPPFRPPPYVFGPAWTTLYGCMGYAAYRAWTVGMTSFDMNKTALAKQGATLYTIQLALNLVWMPLFFKYKKPVAASVDIVVLTGVAGYLTYIWSQVDDVAGYFMLPYMGWLTFATYLCIGAGYLNDWDFASKERPLPPSAKSQSTKYVDEKAE